MKTIDFETSGYFSGTIMFFGFVLALFGFMFLIKSVFIGITLLTISALILTTHYRLKIDYENNYFQDYLWIFGMKYGDKKKFEAIEYLFIKSSRETQTMSMKVVSSTITKEVFDGYLKLSEKDKIHLMTKDNKEALMQKLLPISAKLNIRIIDYSNDVQ